MRVAVVTSLYPSPESPFEGIFAARRWEGMLRRGHTVSVLAPLPFAPLPVGPYRSVARIPRHEERGGIPVFRPRYLHLPGRARGNARRFAALALKHIEWPPSLGAADVVVCDYAWPASAIAPTLARKGIPCVVNGRGSDVLQVAGEAGLAGALAENLRAASGLCAVSLDLTRTMEELAGAHGTATLVPNGVDVDLFTPGDKAAARERLGQAVEGTLVVVVGHLIPRKDPLLALAAFAAGAPPDARLVFVGRGALEAELHESISARDLSARASLVGERPPEELVDWYRAADLLVLASKREGRPNVVLEALATGTPVLATRAGGTGEVLEDPRMLSEGRDAVGLGAMMADLLAFPPAPEDLRARVLPLSWEASLTALEGCLQNAVARCRQG